MNRIETAVQGVAAEPSLDRRIAAIRKIPGQFGTDDTPSVYAELARKIYVPALTPDFAFIHADEFYSEQIVREAYDAAASGTDGFTKNSMEDLAAALQADSRSLLAFRLIVGFTRDEFAHAVKIVNPGMRLSGSSVDTYARNGAAMDVDRANAFAATIAQLIDGSLFGADSQPGDDVRTKQAAKSDTSQGWDSVTQFARDGVPYWQLLHQRHYGGAFRQLLDATSTKRGDLLEDAVEELFSDNGVPYIRTGSHNQGDIMARFGLEVRPAPDFVIYDEASDSLRALLECKGANDGGTARDKALRFGRLREEGARLGGIPVIAVLGGMGWSRVNDTLGPIVRDCEGRVFTLSTLTEMLTVTPLNGLIGTATS